MEFTWSETKRAANIKAHGLDFLDAASVFEGVTFTFEDDRFSYGEQTLRYVGPARWHYCVSRTYGE